MVDELFCLKKCISLVEEKFHWGVRENWTNSDFIRLSEQISEASGIVISADTLKRVFGKTKTGPHYKPQAETKNALAIYLGFRDWADFVKSPSVASPHIFPSSPAPDYVKTPRRPSKAKRQNRKRRQLLFLSVGLVVALSLTLLLVFFSKSQPGKQYPRIALRGENVTGEPPLNAIFNYDISQIKTDSLLIKYGDGNKDLLLKDKKTISHSFQIPNYYYVVVKADDKIVGKQNVQVLSNGWDSFFYHPATQGSSYNPYNKKKDGALTSHYPVWGPENHQLHRGLWIQFRNIRPFGVAIDSSIFETRFKRTNFANVNSCSDITIFLLGEKRPLRLHFTPEGCKSFLHVRISEVLLLGKYDEIAGFGQDLNRWNSIRAVVKNSTAAIYLNEKLILTQAYAQPMGELNGIIYSFKGDYAIDYVQLSDNAGKHAYREDFGGELE